MKNSIDNEDWSDLEFFKDRGNRIGDSYVSISKLGTISFNVNFIRDNAEKIDGKTHVKLGYSSLNNGITITFVDKKEIDGSFTPFKITKSTNTSGASCASRSFFTKHAISPEIICGRYNASYETIKNRGKFFLLRLECEKTTNP